MILTLQRWIEHFQDEDSIFNTPLIPKGEFSEFKIRMDRIDGYSVEDDELVLIINGNEFFFEYDELIHIELENYFNILNTTNN